MLRKKRLSYWELEVIKEFHAAFCCIYIIVRQFIRPDGVKTHDKRLSVSQNGALVVYFGKNKLPLEIYIIMII